MPSNDKIMIQISTQLKQMSDAEINLYKKKLEDKLKNVSVGNASKGIKLLDQKEIDLYVQKMNNALSRLQIGKDKVFANSEVRGEVSKLNDLLDQFKNKQVAAKEVGVQFDNLKTKVSQVSNEFRNVNKDGYSFVQMTELAIKKMLLWQVAGTAIFGTFRAFKDMLSIIKEVDTALTEINKVLDLNKNQLKDLTKYATETGIAYGRTTTEVLRAIGAFAKAGLDEKMSKQMAQLAVLLSNVGDLTTENAQETLIAANAGYQLGNNYERLNLLISQFNELANKNAIEVNTLTDSWKASASIANQARLSVEQYNALITVAGSATQKSGSEIGNAFNVRGMVA
jgi:hypothetical protein